jgi:hypothetical protein
MSAALTKPAAALPGLDSEGLDFRAASELFAPVRKLARRDFPDAWIQAGRFGGTGNSVSLRV